MSLEAGESEKCYQFLDGDVHCWQGPIAAFRDRQLRPEAMSDERLLAIRSRHFR
jgi:hypothetical protein